MLLQVNNPHAPLPFSCLHHTPKMSLVNIFVNLVLVNHYVPRLGQIKLCVNPYQSTLNKIHKSEQTCILTHDGVIQLYIFFS